MDLGEWNVDMIPFINVGNGDFFCLSVADGPRSGVYYADHEAGEVQRLTASFQERQERVANVPSRLNPKRYSIQPASTP